MNVKIKDKKMKDYKNKWALITGASSGLGADFARQLSQKGMNVIIVARREERLNKLKDELLKKYNNQVEVIVADLASEQGPKDAFDKAIQGKQIQVFINNAGNGSFGGFLDRNLDEYLRTIDLNIKALTKFAYYFIEHASEHGLPSYLGNIASIAAYQAVPRFGVYTGSKKYVRDLSETLAFEFRGTNISVTCISPGGTYTEFMDASGQVLKGPGRSSMMSSEKVVRIGLKALFNKRPAVVTGFMNNIICFMPRLLPASWVMAISHFAFSMSVDAAPKLEAKL